MGNKGANWCSFASNSNFVQQQYDQVTFETWTELTRTLPPTTIDMFIQEQNKVTDAPWFKHITPEFRLHAHATPGFYRAEYHAHCINVPAYTQWLVSELLDPTSTVVPKSPFLDDIGSMEPRPVPVTFQRIHTVESLGQVAAMFPNAALVVNATGLGAKVLKDVMDETVYPIGGQVVVVNARRFTERPRCFMGITDGGFSSSAPGPVAAATMTQKSRCPSPPETAPSRDEKRFRKDPVTYIIPRARSGHVVLGGSYAEGSYDTTVDPDLSERIIENAVGVYPDLLLPPPSEYRRADGSTMNDAEREAQEEVDRAAIRSDREAWKRLEVISSHVGLRPARKNGVRIELDTVKVPGQEREATVVHCYGVGPAGYQASWGIAHQVATLVKRDLLRREDATILATATNTAAEANGGDASRAFVEPPAAERTTMKPTVPALRLSTYPPSESLPSGVLTPRSEPEPEITPNSPAMMTSSMTGTLCTHSGIDGETISNAASGLSGATQVEQDLVVVAPSAIADKMAEQHPEWEHHAQVMTDARATATGAAR